MGSPGPVAPAKKARAAQRPRGLFSQSIADLKAGQPPERSFSHLPMAGVTSFWALPLT